MLGFLFFLLDIFSWTFQKQETIFGRLSASIFQMLISLFASSMLGRWTSLRFLHMFLIWEPTSFLLNLLILWWTFFLIVQINNELFSGELMTMFIHWLLHVTVLDVQGQYSCQW